MNRYYWGNGDSKIAGGKLSQCKVVTTIQFVKNAVSARYNKAKCNKGGPVSKRISIYLYIYQMYFLIESNSFHKIDHRQIDRYV